jgi:hypothetical protein
MLIVELPYAAQSPLASLFPADLARKLESRTYQADPRTPFAARPRILSVGDDPILLRTRELLLRSAGYAVVSVPSWMCVEDDVVRAFDLLILCHTVGNHGPGIVKAVRAVHPQLPILLLQPALWAPQVENAASVIPYPSLLLSTVQHLTGYGSAHEQKYWAD